MGDQSVLSVSYSQEGFFIRVSFNKDRENSQWNVTFNLIYAFAEAQGGEFEWGSGGLSALLP